MASQTQYSIHELHASVALAHLELVQCSDLSCVKPEQTTATSVKFQ